MHRVRVLAVAVLACAPAAAEAALVSEAPVDRDVAVPRAGAGCRAGNSVDVRWAAPAAPRVGVLARLTGGAGDWDLLLLDAQGRRLDASHGLAATEVVQRTVPGGTNLVVRACRLSGASRAARVRIESVRLPAAAPTPKASLLKVRLRSHADGQRLQGLGLDLGEDGASGWLSVVARGTADVDAVRSTGLPFRVAVADLAARDRRERRLEQQLAASVAGELPSGRTAYRDFPAIQQEIKDLTAAHPARARAFELAQPTSQGRPVPAIEIADDVAMAARDGRPTFVVMALHHARE